jgi:multidrug efflux pump subunit AcrA (membrane-fusion protein)
VAPRQRRRAWWRRRLVLVALAVVLLALVAVVVSLQRAAGTATPTPTPASAPLVAHGQIVPVRVARVGTQVGGVVQQLGISPGDSVQAQTPLAWVLGPSGTTEIVTAPFAGSVTNVLVHAGDTLAPGAAVAVVADMRTLQVETNDVDEFLINKVSIGQTVTATIDALDDYAVSATVTNVSLLPQTGPTGNPQYPVILRLGALPPQARAGMSVRITFPG